MSWIVGVTKPCQEAIAATNLEWQGYQYYYPRIKQAKPGKTPHIEPLFRRYLFICITDQWYPVRSTRGMSHVLMNEGGPRYVADGIITELRAREGDDGYIQLVAPAKYRAGDKVRLQGGPFAGQLGLYEGMAPHDRCRVLLNMLGSAVSVTLDESILAAA